MAAFVNEYEIQRWVETFDPQDTPKLHRAARALRALMEWTNQNSDGWAYWTKAHKPAAKLIELLADGEDRQREGDDTDAAAADLTRAFTPIKSFLTRHDASWDQAIAPSLNA